MSQARHHGSGRRDDRHIAGRLGEHRGGEIDPRVELCLHLPELVPDHDLIAG
jgi:hypothetical protein